MRVDKLRSIPLPFLLTTTKFKKMRKIILILIGFLSPFILSAGNGTIFFTNGDISYFQAGFSQYENFHGHTQLLSGAQYRLKIVVEPRDLVRGLDVTWRTLSAENPGSMRDISATNEKSLTMFNVITNTSEESAIELTVFPLGSPPPCTEFTITFVLSTVSVPAQTVDTYVHKFRLLEAQKTTWTNTESDALWNSSDIYMQDDPVRIPPQSQHNVGDFGIEPNTTSETFVSSKDMWIRWVVDNNQSHQNAKYSYGDGSWNRVFAMVRNRGCQTSPSANLRLYWTVARSFEMWKEHWLNYQSNSTVAGTNWMYIGNNSTNPKVPLGGEITINTPMTPMSSYSYSAASSPVSISPLAGGERRIITPVGWRAPNPDDFKSGFDLKIRPDGWPVICLLARLESTGDPMFNEQDRDVFWNVVDNNNIITLNTYVTNNDGTYDRVAPGTYTGTGPNWQSRMGVLFINNPTSTSRIVNLSFNELQLDSPAAPEFNDYGFAVLAFDQDLWDKWDAGGRIGSGISVIEDGLVKVTDPTTATLQNITLTAGEMHRLGVMFEYYYDSIPDSNYTYLYSLGEYDTDPAEHIHAPTMFTTTVLENPVLDSIGSNDTLYGHIDSFSYVISPNPVTTGSVNVNVSLNFHTSTAVLNIYNSLGNPMITPYSLGTLTPGNHSFPVNVSSVPSGTYTMVITAKDINYSQVIIISE
ncbi:MAG TPA: T9SS type A sorting domain-containing protein [Cytophagales bacterium]|nr:T9SS type A sorting domain-containing protein [Cytophagales bacterium]